MSYTYRNTNTGDVYTLADRDSRLDALSNWELVEDADVPERVEQALDRAAGERATIEAAAGHRLDITKAGAEGKVNKTTADETSLPSDSPPVATFYSHQPEQPMSPGGLLDKDELTGRPGVNAKQIGPNPEEHPSTREELEEQARRDEENPPTTGVLARAKADHRSGAVQIGPNPEEHRGEGNTAPAKSAKKAAWVDYAVSRGASEDEAKGLPKEELVERYGSLSGRPAEPATPDDTEAVPEPAAGPAVDAE